MKFLLAFLAGIFAGSAITLFAVMVTLLEEFWSDRYKIGTRP